MAEGRIINEEILDLHRENGEVVRIHMIHREFVGNMFPPELQLQNDDGFTTDAPTSPDSDVSGLQFIPSDNGYRSVSELFETDEEPRPEIVYDVENISTQGSVGSIEDFVSSLESLSLADSVEEVAKEIAAYDSGDLGDEEDNADEASHE
uniref:Uncharacterized protein n=1 Tax=Caenorhabditis japonica TaxID=281687 RepID=A0A8R1DI70_CAEJA